MSNVSSHKHVAHGVIEFNMKPSQHAAADQATADLPVAPSLIAHPISTGPAPGPVVQHATGPALELDEDAAE